MSNWWMGADIYHGNNADMKVAAATLKFILMKTSQDTDFVDDMFKTRYNLAKTYKLPVGPYHFLEAKTASEGVAEAKFFNSLLKKYGYGTGDIIPSCDMEAGATYAGATAFITEVKKVWGKAMLYCSASVVPDGWCGADALWVAQYGPDKPDTVKYPNARKWSIWQSTDGKDGIEPHSLPGLGPCDVDWFRAGLLGRNFKKITL